MKVADSKVVDLDLSEHAWEFCFWMKYITALKVSVRLIGTGKKQMLGTNPKHRDKFFQIQNIYLKLTNNSILNLTNKNK